jgi:uncharacterized membrane protein YkoI
MSTRCSYLIATLALLVLPPSMAGMAYGEPRWPQRDRQAQDDEHAQRPVREAIGEVEHNYRGHVVNVQSLRKDETDEDVYRMRVLQRDGRVKTVTVPAKQRHR